mgnify:CR=1 FL=1
MSSPRSPSCVNCSAWPVPVSHGGDRACYLPLADRIQLQLSPTPAGLLERGRFEGFDLRLTVTEESPAALASSLARGDKPKVRIEGDVQLAAEVNWLIDHVRWDAEEDLARLIGDAPAHTLAQAARQAMTALRSFVAQRPGTGLRTGSAA